jgi:hypothetical protein
MNIAIFETEHFEGSYPVIKLFDYNNNGITIFTYGEAHKQFRYLFPGEPRRYEWKVKPDRQSKYVFILDIYREIKRKKIDIVYLNTISNNFIVYALMVLFLRKVRVILTIHNINSWFEYRPAFSFRRIMRYIGRKVLLSLVSEFNVIAMAMVDQLSRRLPRHKKVYCLPDAVFEEGHCRQTQPPMHERINIVIPGTVDGRRRDYEQAFRLIELLEKSKASSTVIFLGKFYDEYGQRILDKSKTLRHTFSDLKYYNFETVPQPEFDRVMNAAHFVFIPSVLTAILEDGVTELYGVTISSGNLFDAIKHAKPVIIPEPLKIDPFLEQSCLRYKTIEEVAAFLLTLRHDPLQYAGWTQKAMAASQNYTIDKVREKNPGLFIRPVSG